ncbi:MAG: hypothetical protein ACR2PL_22505 [Dehalococcoidia bacterium]
MQLVSGGTLPGAGQTAPKENRCWIWYVAGAAVALAVLFVIVFSMLRGNTAQPAHGAQVLPGGLWVGPESGLSVSGPLRFAARAYPTNPGDPGIAFVNFTVSWEGRSGPWLIACKVTKPVQADVYQCNWNPVTAGVPVGPLRVSFDVYNRAKRANVQFAPNGTRTIKYAPR